MPALEQRAGGQVQRRCGLARVVLVATLGFGLVGAVVGAVASDGAAAAEEDVRRVIASYERAIETKDLELFRTVKPNLSGDEERRLQAAFGSTGSHEVAITILSLQIEGEEAVAQLARRDTLEGSIISSFPQTLELVRASGGWVIEGIGH